MGQESAQQQANLYAAPRAVVEDVDSVQQELAGRRQRLGAAFVDGILIFLFSMLASLKDSLGVLAVVAGVLGIIGVVAVNVWLLNRNGQTIGKYSFDIKIVRTDGDPAGLARLIFLRGLPQWIVGSLPFVNLLSLVDVLFIFRADRRCVHDLIADTMVVKTGS
jgi:uncharacterized RDD family membrane protein YckC